MNVSPHTLWPFREHPQYPTHGRRGASPRPGRASRGTFLDFLHRLAAALPTASSRLAGHRRPSRGGAATGLTARAGLAALVCVALVSFAAPAQAQTTLVSNYESRASGSSQIVGDNNVTNHWVQAQGFTTGSNTGGYTLNSAKFNVLAHDGVRAVGRVTIYSADASGMPGTELHVLSGTISGTGEMTFSAPANTILEPSTSYFLYFEDTNETDPPHDYKIQTTIDEDTDSGLSGWTVGHRYSKNGIAAWNQRTSGYFGIELTGSAVAGNTPPTASNNTVTTNEDTAYTFAVANFNFADTDGDTLALVEVVTPPTVGTLALNTTPVTPNQDVAASDIGNLVFTPAANANGTGYASFTFKVSDGTAKSDSTYTMTVNVTAVNDPATGLPTISGTARVGETLTAATTDIADADGLPASFSYQWVRVDNGTDADISGATSSTYTLVDGDLGKTVKVEVSVTDDGGTDEGPLTSAETATIEAAPANSAPEFSDATLTREVAENTSPNVGIGEVIPEATDADVGATLEYSMEGDDAASFTFDASTRQISTKSGVTYNFEATKNSYSVTIRVSDGTDSDTVAVTINLTNVIELPSAPTGLTVSPTLGVGGSLDASWTAPTNTGEPAVIDYDLQYATSSSGPWSNGPQDVEGTSSTLSGLSMTRTRYWVRVHASNVDGDSGWSGVDEDYTGTTTTSANCPAPTLTGRAQVWSATVSVGNGNVGQITYHGFNSVTGQGIEAFGSLSDTSFQIGSNGYTVRTMANGVSNNAMFFTLDSLVTDTEKAELTLHVCNTPLALSSATVVDGSGFKGYQWSYTGDDWPDYATREVYLSVPSDNSAPTATDGSVTTDEDTAHTFAAADFNFSDTDSGDTLSLVEVVTLPLVGTLTLDGAAVTVNKDVAVADIGKLVFTPAANANGTDYASFTFKVSDGTDKSDSAYTMTVNVTAVNDAATGLPTISGTARVGETLTASTTGIEDVDGLTGVSYTYQWVRVDNGTDSDIASATSSTYTLVDDDLGKTVKVEVSFTDDGGTDEGPLTSAESATIMAATANRAPDFAATTLTREVAENSAADVNVGDVIPEATDADVGATLVYSMEGTDEASFNFNQTSRQITTKSGVTYDRETKDSYSVTIKVSDGTDSDTVAVTINLTNVIELPSAPTGLTVAPTLGAGGSLDASWTAPTNTDKPTITGYKLQYATSSSGPWNNGPQNVTGTSSTFTTGLAEDTLYYVRVLAFNSDGDGAWSSTDSATTRIATTTTNCPAPTLTGRAQIWSATVSAETGRVNDGLVPYIGFNTVTPHDVFGALSDTSFEVGTNSYTVRTLATLPTASDDLFLSLDRHVTDTEKAELTLHVCDVAVALSSATQVDAAGFKAYQWAYGVDWSDYATREAYLSVPSVNTAPTASNGTVTTDEDTAHTFEAGDFSFSDADSGDMLALVEVVTLPLAGTLTLDGAAVTVNKDVAVADIDKLVFTPAANGNGTGYASFTFKVSDGTVKSDSAYTMTVNVTAVNDAATGLPTIGGTARVGATLTAATTDIADADGLPASFSYQWVRVDSGTDSDIASATSSTYTLADADEGKTVKVKVSFTDDGGTDEGPLTSAETATIMAAPTNNAPVFSDATLTRSVAENSAANVNVDAVIPAATDADVGATLEYSMEGADAASFNFNVSTRQITTKSGVHYDFEAKPSHSVTIRVSDGTDSDTVAVTITLTDEADTGDSSLSPSADDVVPARKSQATYSIRIEGSWNTGVTPGGVPTSSPHFTTFVGGIHNDQVTFLESGATASAGVEAMAETGFTGTLVAEVNAAKPNADRALTLGAPGITGGRTHTNNAFTSDHPRITLTSMIAPTPDWFVGVSGRSLLDSSGNWLATLTVNLYPWDAGTEDGTEFSLSNPNTSPKDVISSIRGRGKFTGEHIAQLVFTRTGSVEQAPAAPTTFAATPSDAEVTLGWDVPSVTGITGHEYRRKTDGAYGAWTAIPDSAPSGANEDSFTVTGLTNGTMYTFQLRAVNSVGGGAGSAEDSATPMAGGNAAPEFTDATLTREIAENTAADVNVGAVIPEATDADVGATLVYSMEGTDEASFNFNQTSRQITTKSGVTYDRETKDSYSVTIRVSDGTDSDTVAVTINLTNVIELPSAPTGLTVAPTLGAGGSLDASWTAPTNTDKPTITGYKLQYATVSAGPWSNGPQNVTGTSSTITMGLAENTLYYVRVLAFNTDGDGAWSSTDSATTKIATTSTNCPAPTLTGRAQIWSATVSLETGDVNNLVPYIGFNTVTPHDVFGALSDTSFEVGTNSYTVRTLATIPTIDDALFLSLDRHVTDTEKAELTLHVCDDAVALSSAMQVDAAGFKAYQWAYGVDWSDYATREAYLSVPSDNNPPDFSDTALTREIAENTGADVNVGAVIPEATDMDTGDTLVYSMEGADKDSFNFNVTTRQITTRSGVTYDFEADPSYTVTIRVSDGTHSDTLDVTIGLTDADEPPAAPAAPMVAATAGSTTSLDVSWTAPDNAGKPEIADYDLQYRIGDSGPFTAGPQDQEGTSAMIIELMADTEYEVQVRAVNEEGDGDWSASGTGSTNATVIVNTPPTATDGSVTSNEDTAHAFAAAEFNFADTDSGDMLTIVEVVTLPSDGALTFGGDAATVNLDVAVADIGTLVFTPAANANGTGYASFTFKVSDGTDKSALAYTMTVNVTPVNDPPTGLPTIGGTARVGETLTAATTGIGDVDGLTGVSYTYQWVRVDSGTDTDISGATSSTYTLVGDDEGNTVKVEVSFTDDDGTDEGPLTSAATGMVAPPVNTAPAFPDATLTREVAENTVADANVGDVIPEATDADVGATLEYSMEGADEASFAFDVSTRQISTKAALDHEDQDSYSVTIRVSDGALSDTAAVTINITDVDEPPDAPAAPSVSATTGSATSLDVSWTAPDNAGKPAVTYFLQYRVGDSGNFQGAPDPTTGTSATIAGLAANTDYEVQVVAENEEGKSDWSESGAGRTGNTAPAFSSDTATRGVAENTPADTDVGEPVEAADADNDTLTYTLGGADAASFAVDDTSGQIATIAGVNYDFEGTASYTVTVTADDGNGATDTIGVTIGLTDVDEPPDAPGAPSVSATTGSATSLDVSWTAPANAGKPEIAGYDLQYRVVGDAGWTAGPQDEPGTSATIDEGLTAHTDYEVQVHATNEEGDSDWSAAGEGATGNTTPAFDEETAARSVAENTPADTDIGAALPAAVDADLDTLIYSLGGADAASFAFDAATRQLSTLAALNFEARESYSVAIQADDDNGGTDTIEVTIAVTDVDEPPDAPAAPSVAATPGSTTSLDVDWTAPGNDGRPVITGYDLQYRVVGVQAWTAGSQDEPGTSATIEGVTPNSDYQVQVRARNNEGESDWSESGTGNTGNTAPAFDVETATRSVAENTPADTDIGAAFPAATDTDGDTLIYSLEGADEASFAFDAATRQLSTLAALDFEAKDSYAVTVKADDSNGGSDTIAVTIDLTNVDEPPDAPGAPSVAATPGSTTGLDVEWTAPTNTGRPEITRYDLQYRVGNSGPWTVGPQVETGTSASIAGLTPSTGYEVQVSASNEEGDSGWSEAGTGSTGTPVNSPPAFSNDTLTRSVAENTAPGTDFGAVIPEATDADSGDILVYSLEGADAASFDFDESTRQLSTLAALDFEATDSYAVTIRVSDGNGGTDTVAVTIAVTNVDEPPTAPAAPIVSATSGSTTSLDVTWIAPGNDGRPEIGSYDLRYRVVGDAGWTAGPQDEPGTSATIDEGLTAHTDYEVQVHATNEEGDSDWSVAGTGSTGNTTPTFDIETATRSVAENTAAVTDIGDAFPAATDGDGDTLIYTLEGTDAASFALDAATRQLSTLAALDHEAKDSYSVTIQADDDNGGTDTIEVTITVTDVDEPPDAPAAPSVAATPGSTTSLDVDWTAPGNDGRPVITGYALQYRVVGVEDWTAGPQDEPGTSATIAGVTPNSDYQVQVLARNEEGDSDWSESGTGNAGNTAPVFSVETAARSVAENTPADTAIGAAFPAATDTDGDTLIYTLEGTDAASFAFDAANRQLSTLAALDFEDKASYAVTVKADDSNGGADTIAVTISVTNVDEPPDAPATPMVAAAADSATSLDVSWTAPPNTGKPRTRSYDLRYRAGDSGPWTDGPQDVEGTSATITGLTPNTSYQVQVRASNDEGDGDWFDAGTGSTGSTGATDTAAPEFVSAMVSGTRLVLTFNEALDESSTPAAEDFEVQVTPSGGAPMRRSVTGVRVSGTTIVLTLASAVRPTDTVTVIYLSSESDPGIGDESDNKVPAFSIPEPVNNDTPASNNAPEFPDDTLTREVAENTVADSDIGAVIPAAADADGDTLTYTLEGTDADSFAFDAATRQIKTLAALDHETKASYSVTIKVDDGNGGTDTVDVTIAVADLDEQAPPPDNPQVSTGDGSGNSLTVSWRRPDSNGGPAITGYEVRYREGADGEWLSWPHEGTGTSTTITGLKAETSYQVQVRSLNSETQSDWSATMTGTTGAAVEGLSQGWLTRFGRTASDNTVRAIENRWRGERIANEASHLTLGGRQVNSLFNWGGNDRTGVDRTAGVASTEEGLLQPDGERAAVTGGEGSASRESFAASRYSGAPGGTAGNAFSGGPGAVPGGLLGTAPGSFAAGPAEAGVSRSLPKLRDVLLGSSFFYSASLANAGGQQEAPGQWSLWGDVAATRFDGTDGALTLDGEVATGTVGADLHRGRWLGGVALSYSEGDGSYRRGAADEGALSTELASVNPFVRYEHDERTSVWGVLGYGSGEWALTPEGSRSDLSGDLTTTMVAVGGRGVLSKAIGGLELAIRSDVRATETTSDSSTAPMGDSGSTNRVRVLLEGTRSRALESGGVLGLTLEAGLRYDGGDAETGGGVEVGGGLSYASGRLVVQANARVLATHEDEAYEEWGLGGSLLYRPRSDGSGLSVRLGSVWGVTESGVQSLWARQDTRGLARGGIAMDAAQRFETELGYGIAGRRRTDVLWYPYFGAQAADSAGGALNMGLKLTSGPNLEAGLEFGRRDNGFEAPEHAVQLQGSFRW